MTGQEIAAAWFDVLDILAETLTDEQRAKAREQLADRAYEYDGLAHEILGKAADHLEHIDRLRSPELRP